MGKIQVGKTNVEGMKVILVIIDSLRKDHVGAYGNDQAKTPNLDAITDEGLRFTRAYPDAMPTIPARRAINTGMRTFPYKDRPEQQRRSPVYGWLPIPEEQPTLAEILQGHGYWTILVTNTYHEFVPPSMNFQRGSPRSAGSGARRTIALGTPLRSPRKRWSTTCRSSRMRSASTSPTPSTARPRRTGSPQQCSSTRWSC